jgi:hypothetical protein
LKTKGAVQVANKIETVGGEGELNSAFYFTMYKGFYTKRPFKMKGTSIESFYQANLMSRGTHAMHNKGITGLDAPRDHVTTW